LLILLGFQESEASGSQWLVSFELAGLSKMAFSIEGH
jgi:hypothetical protein